MPSKSLNTFDRQITENAFQISLIAGILFLLIGHPILFNLVDSVFEKLGISLGDTMLTVVHSLVFMIVLFYSIRVVVMYT